MDFELSEEQAMLRDVSRSMLSNNCPPELVRRLVEEERDVDRGLWRRGAELGWTGLIVPEELEGAGQGLVELCLVAEELGRAVAPGPFVDTALAGLAAARTGRTELDDFVAAVSEGTQRVSWAHHGSVAAAWDEEELILQGRATAVQSAGSSDRLLVTATGPHGQLLALVDKSATNTTRRLTLDQTRIFYDVEFAHVRVAASHVLVTEPDDVRWLVDAGTVLTCADALGVGERLLEMTIEYVKVREQFQRPLGSFMSVKHKVADMMKAVRGARAATYYAAMVLDSDRADRSFAASLAKSYCSEAMSALAGEALQTHGGIGFTWEHDLHLYLRRAKVDEVLFGDSASHRERIVAHLE